MKHLIRYVKYVWSFSKQAQYFVAYLTTIGDPWYFWKGSCNSKAHKPVTLSGNATFTKV